MTLQNYTNVLIQLTRDSKNDTAAQLLGLRSLAPLFLDASDTTRSLCEELENTSHLSKAVHRAVTSNMSHPRVVSIGLRILSHVANLLENASNDLIFKENVLPTCVQILQLHHTDIAAVRSALSLLNSVLAKSNESGIVRFQRIHLIGATLNTVLNQNIEDAPTVEFGLAASAFVGNYGGIHLTSTISNCIESHPTDIGVVRAGLSACCHLARTSAANRMSLIASGAFQYCRAILDLRPAHRDIVVQVGVLIGTLLKSKHGRKIMLRGGDANDRLIRLLAGSLPHVNDITKSWFPMLLRSVLTALTMMSLSSPNARSLLIDTCGILQLLDEFLQVKLPSIRLVLDVEMAQAAIKGELEDDARDRLFQELDNDGSMEFGQSSKLNKERGQVMKATRDHNGVVGMKLGSR